jgi:hypothetical protein
MEADLLTPHAKGAQNQHGARINPELEAKVSSGKYIKVKVGEEKGNNTFWGILHSHGLLSKADHIAKLNAHILDVSILRPGDVIYLPQKHSDH